MYDAGVNAEVITIGDELCRGEIVDTNARDLASWLWEADLVARWHTTCGDDVEDIIDALTRAARRSDLVLVTGGLGPTADDLTVEAVCALLGVAPTEDGPSRQRMEQRFERIGFRLTTNNLRQIRVPSGATVYLNPAGLAPAFEVCIAQTVVICMPGVPGELRALYQSDIGDRVRGLRDAQPSRTFVAKRIHRVFGRGESHIDSELAGVLDAVPHASLHYQVSFPETLVKVVVRNAKQDVACEQMERLSASIVQRLGRSCYGVDDDSLPAALGRCLRAAGATLATAESCTGGLVGAHIASIAGASDYFRGGAVVYSNEEKTRQLGVSPQTLREHGAVSEPCVSELAMGAIVRFGVDYAVAVSGIAGPGGGSVDKPVGLVWIAVAGPDSAVVTKRIMRPGSRMQIRVRAAYWALALVRSAVLDKANKEKQ